MKFTLSGLKDLVDFHSSGGPLIKRPSGDDFGWLNSRFLEDKRVIGHFQPYYSLFLDIACEYRPLSVVELGSYWGTAAAHFAAGSPDTQVITIDIHREDKEAQRRTLEVQSRYSNVIYLNEWTWDAFPKVKGRLEEFGLDCIDILFMDAWHEYQYVKREWGLYSQLLADEALVICDDIMDAPGATVDMVKFWWEFDYEKFLNDKVHPGIPMGFVRFIR